MSLSLPGNDLYYLPRDNLPPEEYERIISAYAAWSRICREYEFDDRNNNGRYIINMRENRAASHSRPSRGAREKDKLEKMVFSGEIVMLSDIHGPARLFYIDDDGKLICTDPLGFRFDGAKKIIAEFNNSVSRKDYSRSEGKPRPTQVQRLVRASVPDSRAQQALRTINTKAAGRLLAAGGVYNGNVEGYTKTAQDLGGDANKGFEQVLNKQTAGAAIAVASVAAGLGIGRLNSASEVEKLSKLAKVETVVPKVTAELEVNGLKFFDTNQGARPSHLANAEKDTLIANRVSAKQAKAKVLADGTRETFPNGNMADAHAEIGALQQAHEAGVSKGADINMVVRGKDVCGYCRGDIAAAANAAEVNSLTIHAVDKYGDPVKYTWETGMKSIKVAK